MPVQQVGVKGNILTARARYVRGKIGDDGWKRILARLPPEDRKVLSGQLLAVSFYPMELCLRLDDAIAAELSPREPQRCFVEMGRASAEVNLAGAERIFVRPGEPQHLLKMAPQIYGFYYQVGRRTYEKTGANEAVIRTYGAESVTSTDCLTVMGWHQRALELSGAVDVKYEHLLCRARGADHCAYRFSWAGVLPGLRKPGQSA